MNLNEMIDELNADLSNEYAHMNFYIEASTNVTGLHREELSEFFLNQAKEELNHVLEFRKLIIGLGGVPTSNISYYNISDLDVELLTIAFNLEEKVVSNYVKRIEDTQNLDDKVNAKYIELFLEEQIMDSRKDLDNIREMLKNLP